MLIVRYQGEVGTPVAGGLRERGEVKRCTEKRRKETSKDWKYEVIKFKFYTCIEKRKQL